MIIYSFHKILICREILKPKLVLGITCSEIRFCCYKPSTRVTVRVNAQVNKFSASFRFQFSISVFRLYCNIIQTFRVDLN